MLLFICGIYKELTNKTDYENNKNRLQVGYS